MRALPLLAVAGCATQPGATRISWQFAIDEARATCADIGADDVVLSISGPGIAMADTYPCGDGGADGGIFMAGLPGDEWGTSGNNVSFGLLGVMNTGNLSVFNCQ